MLATVVTQSLGAAQVFFLIALIVAAVACVWQTVTGAIQAALVSSAIAFVAAGLLFFA